MWCFYADSDEPTTIQMFYSQTLNFFILLLQLEKVAVAVCTCLVHVYILTCLSSQLTSSSAPFHLLSSSTPVISSSLSCLTYHILCLTATRRFKIKLRLMFGFHPCLWQICVVRTILNGNDVITIAPTGSRKSMTYWMPVLFIKYGIRMIVTPLKLLGAQFSEMLKGVGISAVSITAANTTNELFDVSDSSHQLLTMH